METLQKQQPWTFTIADLNITEYTDFPADNASSVKAMISNKKGYLRTNFPNRKFKTKLMVKVNPSDLNEENVIRVTREN